MLICLFVDKTDVQKAWELFKLLYCGFFAEIRIAACPYPKFVTTTN